MSCDWLWTEAEYQEYELAARQDNDDGTRFVCFVGSGPETLAAVYGSTHEAALERAQQFVDRVLHPVLYPRGEAY